MSRVLVIAPHPNDETLGVGGTLLKHLSQGDELHWFILTKPGESRWGETEIAAKQKEVHQVEKAYGFKSVGRLNFSPGFLENVPKPELVDVFRGNFELIKPDIIYLPFKSGLNEDYNLAFESSIKALRISNVRIRKILCYELINSDYCLETFTPNVFVDIYDVIDRKLEIMNMYETEIQGYPMPGSVESIKSLAKVRGASVRTEYAEAFMLIREIW